MAETDFMWRDRLERCGLRVETRPGRGRCVIAARAFKAGELIMTSLPVATIPHDPTSRCFRCFAKSSSLLRCSRCRFTRYCSSACQRADWTDGGHSKECKHIGTLQKCLPPSALSDVLLLCRSLQRPRRQEGESVDAENIDNVVRNHTDDVLSMCWHKPPQSLVVATKSLISRLHKHVPSLSIFKRHGEDELVKILYRFGANNFAITDSILLSVGAGVYPSGSLLNHSCNANCVVTYHQGVRQRIHCVRDVDRGEELTHPYVDVMSTTPDRRRKLKQAYNFLCDCALCTTGDSGEATITFGDLATMPRDRCIGSSKDVASKDAISDLRAAENLARAALATQDERQELAMLEKCQALRNAHLHPCDRLVLKTNNARMSSYLAVGDLEKAAEACDRVVSIYHHVYPSHHPMTALQLYTLGNLHVELKLMTRAKKELNHALGVLLKTHGADSGIVKSLRELIEGSFV